MNSNKRDGRPKDVYPSFAGGLDGTSSLDELNLPCKCCKRLYEVDELNQQGLCPQCQLLEIGRDKNGSLMIRCDGCGRDRRITYFSNLPDSAQCKMCMKQAAAQRSGGQR